MRPTLVGTLVSVGSSAIMALGILAADGILGASPAELEVAPSTCLQEAVAPVGRAPLRGLVALCLGDGHVRLTAELTGLSGGAAHAVWLVYSESPTPSQRASSEVGVPVPWLSPVPLAQFGGIVADTNGGAQLAPVYRDLRPRAGSKIHVFVVGWAAPRSGTDRHLAGSPAFGQTPRNDADGSAGDAGDWLNRVEGRAEFWLRGGVDSLEQETG